MADGQGLDIGTLATLVFAALQERFTDAGVTLPERRFIAPGQPEGIAWDQEQMVLTMSGIGQGAAPSQGSKALSAGAMISAMALRHVVFAVQLVRCSPEATGGGKRPPAPEVLTAAALDLMRDAGLVSQALIEVCSQLAGSLPPGTRCEAGAVNTLGPDGGMVAVQGSIAVTAGLLA